MCVAGIDIGTTYSGFAYSFRNDWIRVRINAPFLGKTFLSSQCPSVLLLKPDKSFVAFGFEAQQVFIDLKEDSSPDSDSLKFDSTEDTGYKAKKTWEKYYYFHDFKMLLLNKNVSCLMFYFQKCVMHEHLFNFNLVRCCVEHFFFLPTEFAFLSI